MQRIRRYPKKRPPATPGEVLLEEFLKPTGMTQKALAVSMNIPVARVSRIICGKSVVTAEIALLLARSFENTAEFWLTCQMKHDLWHAARKLRIRLD